jgi:hypothetical protein
VSVTRVQSKENNINGGASPGTVAFTSNVTAGNLLALIIVQGGAANRPVGTVSDNLNGNWTKRSSKGVYATDRVVEVWTLENTLGGACTVSIPWTNGTDSKDCFALEYSGLATSSATDVADGVIETSSTSHNTTSATVNTSANGGVLLACAGLNGSQVTLSPESGFAGLGNANVNCVMMEQIVSGSYSGRATFTTTTARTSCGCFLSLKAAAGGGLLRYPGMAGGMVEMGGGMKG